MFYTNYDILATLGNASQAIFMPGTVKQCFPLKLALGRVRVIMEANSSSEYEIIEVQGSALSVDSGWQFAVRGLILTNHSNEEVWRNADQVANLPHPLRHVYVTPCSLLVRFFCVHQFNYDLGMVTVTLCSVVNPNEARLSKVF